MAIKSVKDVKRKEYYIFSPFLRIFHWVMVVMILVLFGTGLLITKPMNVGGLEPAMTSLSMDLVRDIHFLAAFILCAGLIMRVYGFIINKGDRLFPRVWEGHFYSETVEVALHYMLLKGHHAPFLRNPLARGSYAMLYVLLAVEILTGFAMYLMANPSSVFGSLFGWVNVLVGSEMMSHYIHHYVAWFIILFAIGHFYMVVRAEFMEGESEVSSMFSGKKVLAHTPKDANELD
ncbi:MAG: Ni/Fe-hydrogenase, b-type cytochrome subunit [Selenomonadaceae bacterium]|nr:Ni/Fe-hydrogenase, b-type cytochrome subunit [Selenomonadaceae bacterium]MBQ7723577.1 Ni/Fe-hydrogenase, b-type cytochrome subunit [Selenomonadaceae bacterium]